MFQTSYLHPMAVHFPIALIMIGFIVDLVSMSGEKTPVFRKQDITLRSSA